MSYLHGATIHIKLNLFFPPINLPYVSLIIRTAAEPRMKEEKFFLPYSLAAMKELPLVGHY